MGLVTKEEIKEQVITCPSKIKNGSSIKIGESPAGLSITVNKHFNWFQKMMLKWCFGFQVTDYAE